MCIIDATLKLCTCSDKIDTSQPHWRLYRKTIIQPDFELHPVGKVSYLEASLGSDMLIHELNQRNCFDFDYEPLKDDKLIINLITEKLEFVFKNYRWEVDTPSFEKITRSMQAKGYLKNEN